MNASAEHLLGVSLNQAAQKALTSLCFGIESLAELCDRAMAEQKSFGGTVQLQAARGQGRELEFEARISPLNDIVAGGVMVELLDITSRHQVDRESTLVAQHGVSRRIIRQLAHEIRNPLGGLRGAAQLLERELPDPSLREFTQVIIGEADRLAGLMDNLLGPGQRPNRQLVNVHELLERVVIVVESEWPGQQFERDYDPSLPDLYIDRNHLTQALLNLTRNAAQSTGGTGRIQLRTRVVTNQLINKASYRLIAVLEVRDDGPGVPQEIADTLFYPLVTGREGGTGLGLPLAQDLVSRHKGLIEYESVPGDTVFRIQLPVLKPGQPDEMSA